MLARVLFAAAFVLGFAGSQSVYPSGIPKVPIGNREQWCEAQVSSCPLICATIYGGSQTPAANNCSPKTLAYSCICANGQAPNASEYTQTIPYFICTQQNSECVNNCNGVESCQFACRAQHPCGAQHPKHINATKGHATATVASTSSAAASDVVYTGFGSAATKSAKEGASPMTMSIDLGRVYGLLVVMGGIMAGFGLLL